MVNSNCQFRISRVLPQSKYTLLTFGHLREICVDHQSVLSQMLLIQRDSSFFASPQLIVTGWLFFYVNYP